MYRGYDSYASDDRRHQTPPTLPLPRKWERQGGTEAALRTADNPPSAPSPIPSPYNGASPTQSTIHLHQSPATMGGEERGNGTRRLRPPHRSSRPVCPRTRAAKTAAHGRGTVGRQQGSARRSPTLSAGKGG